jgi:hypothetical protein
MKNSKKFPETPDRTPNSPLKPTEMGKNAFDLVNEYGTYEIQPTCDNENQYPAIAQGYNSKIVETDRQNKHSKNAKWESTDNGNKGKQ